METIDFVKKLEKILSYYHLSASAFADKIGFQRSSMSHLLSGRNKPSLDFVVKISTTFKEVDINWFLFDIGTFPKSPNTNSQNADVLLVKSNEELTIQNQKLNNELHQLLDKYNELSSKTTLFNQADEQFNNENIVLKRENANLKQTITDLEALKNNSSISSDLSEQILSDNESFKSEIELLKLKLQSTEFEISKINVEKNELFLKLEQLKGVKNQYEDLLSISNLDKMQMFEYQSKNEQLNKEIAVLGALNLKVKSLENQLELSNEKNEKNILEKSDLNEQLNTKDQQINELLLRIEELNAEKDQKNIASQEAIISQMTPPSEIEQVMILYKNGVFKAYRS